MGADTAVINVRIWPPGVVGATSIVYGLSMLRVVMFLNDRTALNSSARGAILTALFIPLALYLVVVVQWILYRSRMGSPLPVVAAALFGAVFCYLFTGFGW